MCVYINTYTYVCMYVCMYVYIYINILIHMLHMIKLYISRQVRRERESNNHNHLSTKLNIACSNQLHGLSLLVWPVSVDFGFHKVSECFGISTILILRHARSFVGKLDSSQVRRKGPTPDSTHCGKTNTN